jgi:DNA (cytosine-5)-methyltransferase 1
MRIGGTGNPRPLTLPLLTQTARHEAAMVFPNAGNTFERTPGNRARDASRSPLDTVHGTLERAMVVPPMGDVPARPADELPAPTQPTTTRPGLVMANTENGIPRAFERAPSQTLRTEGGLSLVMVHRALVMRNNGDTSGEQSTPALEPIRTLTGKCHQSLVVPYYRTGTATDPGRSPAPTIPTKDRLALLVPYTREGRLRRVDREAATTVATEGPPAVLVTEEHIDDCLFRMFDLPEIAKAMAMFHHVDGKAEYLVTGNRREMMAQYGNAVTPPATELIVSRLLEVIA